MKMKMIQFSIKASVVAFLFATGVGCTYDVTVDHPYEGPIDFLQLFTGNLETASTTPIAITWNVEDEVGVFAGETSNKCFTLRENMNSSAVFEPKDETAFMLIRPTAPTRRLSAIRSASIFLPYNRTRQEAQPQA